MKKPSVEFKINIPELVTFQFNDWKEGEGQYGKWYMYSVENRGEDRVMFASDFLKSKLDFIEPLQGEQVEITKEETSGKKINWKVIWNGEELEGHAPADEPKPAPKSYRPTKEALGTRKEMQNTMDYKAQQIERSQAAKEDSMRLFSSGRDAVLVTVAEMNQGSGWSEDDIKAKIKEWNKFFYNEIYNDKPFI